jgi:hypothetical protein
MLDLFYLAVGLMPVDVLRAGIDLLEKEAERRDRIRRWKRAAALVARTSREVNAEFQSHSGMKRI